MHKRWHSLSSGAMRTGARLVCSTRANVSIIFAFSLIPMIGLVGIGVDYGIAQTDKSKLDNASDAAALAAVATAKAYIASNPNDSNATANAIAAGLDRAQRAFNVNAGALPNANVPTPAITLTRTGQTFTSSASYTTQTTTNFGKIFGSPTITIKGTVAASADIPSYLDFYLLLDVSGSMGLPSTTDGATYLANNNGTCQFACHFPGSNSSGYNFALAHTIQLRSGAVNTAVCGLLKIAASPVVPNQYRVGLYPFISQMSSLSDISYDFNTLSLAADCASNPPMAFTKLLDTGQTQLNNPRTDPTVGLGSGGTHFEGIFSSLQNKILHFGDGTSALLSRPFVFLVTDGMQNSQHYASKSNGVYAYPGNPTAYSGYSAANFDGSSPAAMTASLCSAIKQAGATISVLYIPYVPLTVGPQNQGETNATNAAIPNLPITLKNCASNAAYFYTANTPADINSSLAAMFAQAIQVAHLSQ